MPIAATAIVLRAVLIVLAAAVVAARWPPPPTRPGMTRWHGPRKPASAPLLLVNGGRLVTLHALSLALGVALPPQVQEVTEHI